MTNFAKLLEPWPLVASGAKVERPAAGGFSGADVWRVTKGGQSFCLRRWPEEHPTPQRLVAIHSLLTSLGQQGVTVVPVPLAARDGKSFVEREGRLWELAPWMPGTADYHRDPSDARLAAAMEMLARVHSAAAIAPSGIELTRAPSPGLLRRQDRLHRLAAGEFGESRHAVARAPSGPLRDVVAECVSSITPLVAPTAEALDRVAPTALALQWCQRDIWHDHVLFTGEQVTGLIDWGAADVDSVAGDLARLLGSLVTSDADGWQRGLAAYEAIRPLSDAELRAVPVFDTSGLLLAAANWARWLFVERRRFADTRAVVLRIESLLARLRVLAVSAAASDDPPPDR